LPTWGELEQRLRPRWVLWAVLAVLVLDVRALVHLHAEEGPGCARGTVPDRPSALRTSLTLVHPSTRSGQDVPVVLRLENAGKEPVVVAGLQAVVVAPADERVLGWADAAAPLGLVVRPGEFGEVPLVVHLARCPDRTDAGLAPGWYELVVVVTETGGRARSQVRPVVVAP
jgi:hypothetical protein